MCRQMELQPNLVCAHQFIQAPASMSRLTHHSPTTHQSSSPASCQCDGSRVQYHHCSFAAWCCQSLLMPPTTLHNPQHAIAALYAPSQMVSQQVSHPDPHCVGCSAKAFEIKSPQSANPHTPQMNISRRLDPLQEL